jgi:hypothetical protein
MMCRHLAILQWRWSIGGLVAAIQLSCTYTVPDMHMSPILATHLFEFFSIPSLSTRSFLTQLAMAPVRRSIGGLVAAIQLSRTYTVPDMHKMAHFLSPKLRPKVD